jgi:ribosome-associated toxin RatA of RatAB toxin-antitoxin module
MRQRALLTLFGFACCMFLACAPAYAQVPPPAPAPGSTAPARVEVQAQAQGSGAAITARAVVEAPLTTVWETLTDYGNLARFVPGLKSSVVKKRERHVTTVEQHGDATFMFFSHAVQVTVTSSEYPPHRIDLALISGNLKQLAGRYDLTVKENGVLVVWQGVIEPDFALPAFLEVPVMRKNIESQFVGMVREIERRAAAARTAGGAGQNTGQAAGQSASQNSGQNSGQNPAQNSGQNPGQTSGQPVGITPATKAQP